jgi:FAD/FMN-containing dehydrogenase/Fe-S oxidoreductase
MAGNNACGTRSIRYGIMRDNVLAIDAILADGTEARFGEVGSNRPHSGPAAAGAGGARELMAALLRLGEREAAHIARAFPAVSRRVGGYLIDALLPTERPVNLATLLVGSEGTLAVSRRIELKLSALPRNKALGVCHFPTFRQAMEAAQHIVALKPVAVELVDRTLIELARDNALFRPVMQAYVEGAPQALLLVEFAEEEQQENVRRLESLAALMRDLGPGGRVIKVTDAAGQNAIWAVRAAGLNIMMSMKSEGKPVSFIEDCAVPLEHLADYTDRLTEVFARHGTRGTWYAHASVGCLHVRPVLNLKLEADARKMRAIAEEAFALVKAYKGSHSGEHGDGIVRSEFHARMYGEKTLSLFEEVKDRFDPAGLLNPGKIVRAPAMNDRTLFRYYPGYAVAELKVALRWPGYAGAGGGFQGAVEMCNNNGECRKRAAGVMCPSFRVTGNERDVTRGRANTLRLAISGQLGPDALASPQMLDTLKLCVSCKACRRECPTGVDMAKMKIEVLAAAAERHGLGLHERLVGYLPRYAPIAARFAGLLNGLARLPPAMRVAETLAGFSEKRPLPRWCARARLPQARGSGAAGRVALFADTFNTYFEPATLAAASELLARLGYRVEPLALPDATRPVCCGRTFLAVGLVEEARAEARRLLDAARPFLARGVPIVGLEPSCLFTLKDEFQALLPPQESEALAQSATTFEEFLAREAAAGRIRAPIGRYRARVLLHGHCHQKAYGVMGAVNATLALVEGLTQETIDSSCCGMAGAFGYGADTYAVSMRMGELSLLPAVRRAPAEAVIAADGFSCRHQIRDGTGRAAVHVARVLAAALNGGQPAQAGTGRVGAA